MPITGKLSVSTAEKKVFDPIPKGIYQFELVDITLKEGKKWNSEETEEKLSFKFACLKNGEFYGRYIWKDVSQKLSKYKGGSALYIVLTGLLDRQLTDEEVDNAKEFLSPILLNDLIGMQVILALGQAESEKSKTIYNTIESIQKAETTLPKFNPELRQEKQAAASVAKPAAEPDFGAEEPMPEIK